MTRKISKNEMFELYAEDVLTNIVNLGDRIVAHNYKGQGDNPQGFEVVWCDVPGAVNQSLATRIKEGLLRLIPTR